MCRACRAGTYLLESVVDGWTVAGDTLWTRVESGASGEHLHMHMQVVAKALDHGDVYMFQSLLVSPTFSGVAPTNASWRFELSGTNASGLWAQSRARQGAWQELWAAPGPSSGWQQVSGVVLPAGTVQLRFRTESGASYEFRAGVDDVVFTTRAVGTND